VDGRTHQKLNQPTVSNLLPEAVAGISGVFPGDVSSGRIWYRPNSNAAYLTRSGAARQPQPTRARASRSKTFRRRSL